MGWLKRLTRLFAAMVLSVTLLPATVLAADANEQQSIQSVAQSYQAEQDLQQGLLVRVDPDDTQKVLPSSYEKATQTFGVVVGFNATPVSLSQENASTQVYVITSGRYPVFVSTQNGVIAAGDLLAPSAIDGVAMKADDQVSTVIGRAVSAFDGKANVVSNTQLKTASGKQKNAQLGLITVDLAIGNNPDLAGQNNGVPQVFQSIARAIAGDAITPAQLYASFGLLVLGTIIAGVLMYSGIKTGMSAIGRNPLAKKSIVRNMLQVLMVAVMIFIGCLIAVYLILRL